MLTVMPNILNKTPALKNIGLGPLLIRGEGPGDAPINPFHVKHSSEN